jgi:hypothetical protein
VPALDILVFARTSHTFENPFGEGTRLGAKIGVWSSASVAETSGSAWQGAKISASVDDLAPTQLHLVTQFNFQPTTKKTIPKKNFNSDVCKALYWLQQR